MPACSNHSAISDVLWFKYDLGHKYHAPQVRLTGVQTHDLQIMTTFHVTEMPALTIRPSVTSARVQMNDTNASTDLVNELSCKHTLITMIPNDLTLTVLVTTIDALGHFQTGQLQHSGRGWGMQGRRGTSRHYFPHAQP